MILARIAGGNLGSSCPKTADPNSTETAKTSPAPTLRAVTAMPLAAMNAVEPASPFMPSIRLKSCAALVMMVIGMPMIAQDRMPSSTAIPVSVTQAPVVRTTSPADIIAAANRPAGETE